MPCFLSFYFIFISWIWHFISSLLVLYFTLLVFCVWRILCPNPYMMHIIYNLFYITQNVYLCDLPFSCIAPKSLQIFYEGTQPRSDFSKCGYIFTHFFLSFIHLIYKCYFDVVAELCEENIRKCHYHFSQLNVRMLLILFCPVVIYLPLSCCWW